MKTKGQRKAEDRRAIRKREKFSEVARSCMAGNAVRRGYGMGIVDK